MKKLQVIGLIVTGLLLLAISAQAYTIVTAEPGKTQYIKSVSEVATGPDMAYGTGMVLTVTGYTGLSNPSRRQKDGSPRPHLREPIMAGLTSAAPTIPSICSREATPTPIRGCSTLLKA
jgi:hypothetical protein